MKYPLEKEKKSIRKRIKDLRDRLDLTQEEFALKLGVSWVTVARWEKKRNNATPSRLAKRAIEQLEKRR